MNRRRFLTNCFRSVATAAAMSYAPRTLLAPVVAKDDDLFHVSATGNANSLIVDDRTGSMRIEVNGHKYYIPVYEDAVRPAPSMTFWKREEEIPGSREMLNRWGHSDGNT